MEEKNSILSPQPKTTQKSTQIFSPNFNSLSQEKKYFSQTIKDLFRISIVEIWLESGIYLLNT